MATGSAAAPLAVSSSSAIDARTWSDCAKRLGGAYRIGQLPGIDLLPGPCLAADEVTASGTPERAGVLDAGRRRCLVTQRACRPQQPSPCTGDHLVRWAEMFEG